MSSIDNLHDDFFDNIADYEEDFSFVQNNKSAFYFAKKEVLENNSNSSTDDNYEDELDDDWSEAIVSIADIDTDLEIEQKSSTDLSRCVIMNIIDGKLQKCNSDFKLRGLWQLIGTWQLDNHAVFQVNKDLNKLDVCYTHFMFDQNQLHEADAKEKKCTTKFDSLS